MNLQITTKCNMNCDHCGYSCNMQGKDGEFEQIVDNINFCLDYDNECISIGGGEPTIHERFFDILEMCLQSFENVWFATNGSFTKKMYRIIAIMNNEDFYYQLENDFVCDCDKQHHIDDDNYECECEQDFDNYIQLQDENQLSVALSLDCFHSQIDENIENIWRKNATSYHKRTGFEVRDVSHNVIDAGRAKENQVANDFDSCICSDIVIEPDGKIKLCGCKDSPIIGHVNKGGIFRQWENIMQDENFAGSNCFKVLSKEQIEAYKTGQMLDEKPENITVRELKRQLESTSSERYYFTPETMDFFGDTFANYGVKTAFIEDKEVWELYRKQPVKMGNQESAYFDKLTLKQVHKRG